MHQIERSRIIEDLTLKKKQLFNKDSLFSLTKVQQRKDSKKEEEVESDEKGLTMVQK
jgi:hypothetical protein